MKVSFPTLSKYYLHPEYMTGIQRKKLAKLLNISIEVMNDICDGKVRNLQNFAELPGFNANLSN